jgi:hypothetical protein
MEAYRQIFIEPNGINELIRRASSTVEVEIP